MSTAPANRSLHASESVPPRLALNPDEAASSIGCSRSFFDETILRELRVVRRGRRVFIPTVELVKWLDRNAARPLEGIR
jgi:hypothetical protein